MGIYKSMLVFVGLGIYDKPGIPMSAISDIIKCRRVLLDSYTSPINEELVAEIKKTLGRDIELADRSLLEDPVRVVDMARNGGVAILVPGDVFVATTHETLRQEAARRGVEVRTWFSSSIVNAALEYLGLHVYKIGFVGTIVRGGPSAASRVYFGVSRALLNGQHSVVLLEYNASEGYHVSPNEALRTMLEAEKTWGMSTFNPDRVVIIVSRLGWRTQQVDVTTVNEALEKSYGDPPHTIVVPGKLHYTERESLAVLFNADTGLIERAGVLPLSRIERAVINAIRKTREALPRFRASLKNQSVEKRLEKGVRDLLENVECYLDDAERFLKEGYVELALAEAGYAEGLLDSLRLLGLANVKW